MLVVTVEVLPGGNVLKRRVIGTMNLVNISGLDEVSDYVGNIDGKDIEVKGHKRSDGAWVLVKKALDQTD